jgi:hypothetical protein
VLVPPIAELSGVESGVFDDAVDGDGLAEGDGGGADVGTGRSGVVADREILGADAAGAARVSVGIGDFRIWDAAGEALGVVMTPIMAGVAVGPGRIST